MAVEDRKRWDEKHTAEHKHEGPSPFLQQTFQSHAWRIPPGKVLDIATGKGRNALFLAAQGFLVEAIDISAVGLREGERRAAELALSVTFKQVDLDRFDFSKAVYDVIVNFNFLQRQLIPKMKQALKLGGYIVFETYLVDQRVLGHPRNPAYLLGHNELLELFRDFRILYYREGQFVDGGKEAYRAGLFGQKIK